MRYRFEPEHSCFGLEAMAPKRRKGPPLTYVRLPNGRFIARDPSPSTSSDSSSESSSPDLDQFRGLYASEEVIQTFAELFKFIVIFLIILILSIVIVGVRH